MLAGRVAAAKAATALGLGLGSGALLTQRRESPLAFSAGHAPATYDLQYYTKAALAGGICCSITHASLCPVDVVKTRIQLDPVKYNKGMLGTFRTVVAEEGAAALTTGLGATAAGYFVQGWFKFGGVEFFKVQFASSLGDRSAWNNRTSIYLASSAMAEFIADLFLCPLEAVRIRSVSDKTFPKGLAAGAARMISTDGVLGFYAGLGPILFKQVPYTMAKFAVQGLAAEQIFTLLGQDAKAATPSTALGVALGSGVIAGVAAAVISHPADTLLSKINKAGAGGTGSTVSRLANIAREVGFWKLCTTGLGARCVMIGTLTAGQFAIFDSILLLTGAGKFHFTNPDEKHLAH